jgi:hypothetical protein
MPKVHKRKASALQSNLEFMKVCQHALEKSTSETTEYEAVGINVGKKLEKMEKSQAIYAESLINIILSKGLLQQLTLNTIVCETSQKDNVPTFSNHYSPSSSSNSTEIYPPPNYAADNLQNNNVAKFYEESSAFLNLQ